MKNNKVNVKVKNKDNFKGITNPEEYIIKKLKRFEYLEFSKNVYINLFMNKESITNKEELNKFISYMFDVWKKTNTVEYSEEIDLKQYKKEIKKELEEVTKGMF